MKTYLNRKNTMSDMKAKEILLDTLNEYGNFNSLDEFNQMLGTDMAVESVLLAMQRFMEQQNKGLIEENEKLKKLTGEFPNGMGEYEWKIVENFNSKNHLIKTLEAKNKELVEENERLTHYETTTIGLWVTDRPDLVNDPKKIMFQLK